MPCSAAHVAAGWILFWIIALWTYTAQLCSNTEALHTILICFQTSTLARRVNSTELTL